MRTNLTFGNPRRKTPLLLFLHVAISTRVLLFLSWPRGKEREATRLLRVVEVSPKQHSSPLALWLPVRSVPLQHLAFLHFCVQYAVILITAKEWVCADQ